MNLLIITGLLLHLKLCLGANILFIIPMPARSHYNLGDRLIRELSKRGHEVTLISPFQMTKPPKEITEIIMPNLERKFSEIFKLKEQSEGKFGMRNMSPWFFLLMSKLGEVIVENTMESKSVQDFMKLNKKFDLIIGECFLSEALIGGFSQKFKAPLIFIATFLPNVWANEMVGNPAPLAYVAEPILPYTSKMTFYERCINVLYKLSAEILYYNRHIPSQDALMRKYFGNEQAPLREILSNTSFMFVNHHYSLAFPRPYVPNMVEIGSYHVKPVEPLPKDLQTFMDEAKNGVILFSMGSHLPSSDFPMNKIRSLLNAFGKLKQRVLWKFEKDNLSNLPSNVRISKWLPQTDILAHPNTKLFITHGGILSVTEAVLRGVPLVAIPVMGDQPMNIKSVEELEIGVKIEYDEISDETLSKAIAEVLNNPKYAKNIKHRSEILRDVPIPQIDKAIFWIEYAIRHKGAPHLRSPAQDLSWYQMYLLDVLGFLGLVFSTILFILFKIMKFFYSLLGKKKASIASHKKKN